MDRDRFKISHLRYILSRERIIQIMKIILNDDWEEQWGLYWMIMSVEKLRNLTYLLGFNSVSDIEYKEKWNKNEELSRMNWSRYQLLICENSMLFNALVDQFLTLKRLKTKRNCIEWYGMFHEGIRLGTFRDTRVAMRR